MKNGAKRDLSAINSVKKETPSIKLLVTRRRRIRLILALKKLPRVRN